FRENFINISVDIEGDVEMVDFSGETMSQKDFAFKKHRVRATPVMAFFNFEGKRIARVIGAVSGPTEFIWFGEYVVSGAHEKTSWTRYKRERKAAARQ
ncbi:MAG: thioredoxin family protein, partial [Gammaproteobacteria bacterium]